MSGFDELKMEIERISRARDKRLKNIYLARVTSTNPFKIANAFFGEIEGEHLYILENTRISLSGIQTTSSGNHSHSTIPKNFKVGDELLIMIYEQEMEQRFIVIDKVVRL